MSGFVADGENIITPSSTASGAAPSIAPLHVVPRMIFTPSTSVSFLYAVIASAALHFESSITSSSGRPFMPPLALISSSASCLAFTIGLP